EETAGRGAGGVCSRAVTSQVARSVITGVWSGERTKDFRLGAKMSTAISILGGVGLFLLGMTVMTDGLKALAGSALRTVLAKAAATPLVCAFLGAIHHPI